MHNRSAQGGNFGVYYKGTNKILFDAEVDQETEVSKML